MKKLIPYYPLYQRCHYRRMPVVLIKRAALRQHLAVGIVASSLAGLLSGCLSSPASVIPHNGPTMQAIYTRTAQPSTKSSKRRSQSTRQKSVIQARPKRISVVIFTHPVQVGHERIVIPTYTVQCQVTKMTR